MYMRQMSSHGERLLCKNHLWVVNGNSVNRDQAALERKVGRSNSAKERWEAHQVSLVGPAESLARTPERES